MSATASAPQAFGQPQQEGQQPPSPTRRSIVGNVKGIASTALSIAQLALSDTTPAHAAHEVKRESEHGFELLVNLLKENTPARDAVSLLSVGVQSAKVYDDRKLLLEQVIVLLSSLPPEAPIGTVIQNSLVSLLWRDLPKPVSSLVGDYKYRKADGSGNNPFVPDYGKAGMPYARSVAPVHPLPEHLPDYGVIFDSLMSRDKFEPHPSGISSMLFAFANLIIHSIFQSNHQDPDINDASSYLDLSPVYGNNEEEQRKIRTGVQGKIHPDTIASQRLFMMPPSSVAMAILFARNHNWICDKLVEVNENNQFAPWTSLDEKGKLSQDLRIFEIARNVNCGWFVNVIFQDYIKVILNVNQTGSKWALVPTGEIDTVLGGKLPRGDGNHVSVEFSILYRWHTTMSEKDEKWMQDLMRKWTKKPFDQLSSADFFRIIDQHAKEMGDDPRKWTFGNFKRCTDGHFRDEDLVKTFSEATDTIAGAFKACGIPAVMRVIDCIGMQVAREKWRVATLNEFRRSLGLTEYTTFEEWNPDNSVAENARRLYGDVKNLELYPGMMAEQAKPSQAGSGLAPGYTISRAILSDAVALVRGDRFLTHEYGAGELTSWMWKDLQPDVNNGAFGGSLSKLLMRHFPSSYTFNSSYACFPFSTPHTTRQILEKLGLEDRYDLRRPTGPAQWVDVRQYQTAKTILDDSTRFANVFGPALAQVTKHDEGFAVLEYLRMVTEKPKTTETFSELLDTALFPPNFAQNVLSLVGTRTEQQLKAMRWDNGKNRFRLDLVSDVAVPVAMETIADLFGLPLKTKKNPLGLWTPEKLYEVLTDIFTYVYLNFDPTTGFALRDKVMKEAEALRGVLLFRLGAHKFTPDFAADLARDVRNAFGGKGGSAGYVVSDRARKTYERLNASKRPIEELVGACMVAIVRLVTVVPQVTNVVDFYMKPRNRKHLDKLVSSCQNNLNAMNDSEIIRSVEEAMRLQPAIAGTARRVTADATLGSGDKTVELKADTLVWIRLRDVMSDPTVFKDADQVRLDRDPRMYEVSDRVQSVTSARGESFNTPIITGMVREILSQHSLARAPGAELVGSLGPKGIPMYSRKEEGLLPSAFPSSFVVTFEDPAGQKA
ncbi:peroxidase/cytochrome P450 family protein [Rhodotorula paludigena]|uniref:peroxidase/cytochrome P450 family protein n=1 Tax=Rhodotorula paludigena TaxID=86838 RepID=UPI003176DBBE